jgi:anti-sigma B factor antagonist
MYSSGPIIVMQVPERLNQTEAEVFLGELKPILEAERPRIVLDCSEVQYMESAGVEMLLRCMEEAMKRDGDVKLAAVAPTSAVILELMKVDRLFEVFDTSDEAVRSFHAIPPYASPENQPWLATSAGEFDAAS